MQPVISEKDYNELGEILIKEKTKESGFLRDLLKKLRIVKDHEISKKTIRLNSVVLIWHSLLKKIVKLRLVSPNKADLKTRKVSILTPIGMALMGRKENDNLTINMPGVEKQLRVIKVTNE